MSLRDRNKIDIIAKTPESSGFDLIAVDNGDIKNEKERYNLMIKKLLAYTKFISSGQIYRDKPEIKGKEIRLCVLCKTPPNEAMVKVEAIKTRDPGKKYYPVKIFTNQQYPSHV